MTPTKAALDAAKEFFDNIGLRMNVTSQDWPKYLAELLDAFRPAGQPESISQLPTDFATDDNRLCDQPADAVERVALAMVNGENRRLDMPELSSVDEFRLQSDRDAYLYMAEDAIAAMPAPSQDEEDWSWLYRHQPPPQERQLLQKLKEFDAVERVAIPLVAFEFLMGEGPMAGCQFGEYHPTRKGAFWWRRIIREQMDAMSAPVVADAAKSLSSQIDRLASYIMAEIDGEPSESEGAVDTAIRIMRKQAAAIAAVPETVERVARFTGKVRKIYNGWYALTDYGEDTGPFATEQEAQAAIAAMRPTISDAMVEAGAQAMIGTGIRSPATHLARVCIKAALETPDA